MCVPIDKEAAERIAQLESRLRIISASVRAFAEATTDYERLLDVVTGRLAEVVKDGCVLRLLGDDGMLSAVAIHLPFERRVTDQATVERVRAHVARPQNVNAQGNARAVLERSGEPLLIPQLDLDSLRATTTPEIMQAYETIGIHSLLLVPLRARGASLGLLSLVRFEPDSPPYTEARPRLGAGARRQLLRSRSATHAYFKRRSASWPSASAPKPRCARPRNNCVTGGKKWRLWADSLLAASPMTSNNLLSVVLGHASLLLTDPQATPRNVRCG